MVAIDDAGTDSAAYMIIEPQTHENVIPAARPTGADKLHAHVHDLLTNRTLTATKKNC